MAKIIAVANQKGGVGKTTTAVNLAASLAYYGQETLVVDMDPQGNATSGLGIDKNAVDATVYEALIGERDLSAVIKPTAIDWLELVPSRVDLIGAEIELINSERRETRLKNLLSPFDYIYKYIFIDCPPSLGLLTLNSFCAAQSVIIPMQCEFYAMEGLTQLMDTIGRVQKSLNPALDIEGVLFTMYDSRITLAKDVVGEVRKVFGDKVYNTMISRTVRLAEAPSFGKPVLELDFSSKGAQIYLQLAREFLAREGIIIDDHAARVVKHKEGDEALEPSLPQ